MRPELWKGVTGCEVQITTGQNAMSIYANSGKGSAAHVSSQTHDVTRNPDVRQNAGGPAALVVMSFAFICIFGITALANGYGILMSLLLAWVLSLALILAGVLAMVLRSVWTDYCEKRQTAQGDRNGYTSWNKNIAFNSASGSKTAK